MLEWLKAALSIRRVPWRFVLALWMICGLVLFAPDGIRSALYLRELIAKHGGYLAGGWLVIGALLVTHAVGLAIGRLRKAAAVRRLDSNAREYLDQLDALERAVLREFFIPHRNTVELPIDQPAVAGLLQKGLLVRVGTTYEHTLVGTLVSLGIRKAVLELLTCDDLGLPPRELDPSDLRRLAAMRPPFMKHIEDRRFFFEQ